MGRKMLMEARTKRLSAFLLTEIARSSLQFPLLLCKSSQSTVPAFKPQSYQTTHERVPAYQSVEPSQDRRCYPRAPTVFELRGGLLQVLAMIWYLLYPFRR